MRRVSGIFRATNQPFNTATPATQDTYTDAGMRARTTQHAESYLLIEIPPALVE